MNWFDIGVNLTDERLPLAETVDHAVAAGVSHLLATGSDIASSEDAIKLAEQYPGQLFSTAGIHPHYAKDAPANFDVQLAQLAASQQVVAIGECGLDFNRNFSPPEAQLRVFEAQLAVAAETGLPVFLHQRDAFEPQLALLKKYRQQLVGGVAHCFTGDIAQMEAYLGLDLYIGITGWVCDLKRGEALRHALRSLPLERLLLETDAPYLFPKTLRPRKRNNVPANLPHIGQEVATLMGLSDELVAYQSYQNSLALFNLQGLLK